MNVGTIKAALPAAIVAALTSDPQGVTSTDQVYFDDRPRPFNTAHSAEAWCFAPTDVLEPIEPMFGVTLYSWEVDVRVMSDDGSADLESWGDLLLDYFHAQKVPSGLAGLIGSKAEIAYDLHPGEGYAKAVLCSIQFLGWRDK